MASENSLNFVKETCLMKCNAYYEDQCCTSCFKSEGTKNTECPSYLIRAQVYAKNNILHVINKKDCKLEKWTILHFFLNVEEKICVNCHNHAEKKFGYVGRILFNFIFYN